MTFTKDRSLEDRFWEKVNKNGGDDACWLWEGAKHPSGYGSFRIDNKHCAHAHRVAWMLTYGAIEDGLYVCHRCDNPSCVNPDHLFPGTAKENMKDMYEKGRGRKVPSPGEKNKNAKLTASQVTDIRTRYANGGTSYTKLAKEYGVLPQTIGKLVTGKRWGHLLDDKDHYQE